MIYAYQKMLGQLPSQFRLESTVEKWMGDFICDTTDDLLDLPKDCEIGSIARVIDPPMIYRKSSAGNWIAQFVRNDDEL